MMMSNSVYFESSSASYIVPGRPKRGQGERKLRPDCAACLPTVEIRALDRERPREWQERGVRLGI